MPIRKTQFAPGERYHICIRGNNKQNIFKDESDRIRLLFLTMFLQSDESIPNIHRSIAKYKQSGLFKIKQELLSAITNSRYVALESFAFMDNHAHFGVLEVGERGIEKYMQRVLNAYAKYFNTKYDAVGHLFQGPYRAVHIESNNQLLYLSAYIHRNPRELPGMAGKEHQYRWSSYQDYLGDNRFGRLLDPSIVLEQFDTKAEYQSFVDSSIAKDREYLFHPF